MIGRVRIAVFTVLLSLTVFAVPGQALAQSDEGPLGCGIIWEADISYSIPSGDDVVTVESINTVTYPQDAPQGCNLGAIGIPVTPSALDMSAQSGGVALDVDIELPEQSGYSALAYVQLADRLDPGETTQFSVSYRLPNDDDFISVDSDQAMFTPWVWGSPGHVSLNVAAGDGDTVVSATTEPLSEDTSSPSTFGIEAIADPDDWTGSVVVYRDVTRSSTSSTLGGYPTVLHAIGTDGSWEKSVEADIDSGIPALESLVGLPWPDAKSLDVVEVPESSLNGYAGQYSSWAHLIEVPQEVTQDLMLHELGHAWFNDDVFAEAWMSEGLAETYAYLAESTIADTDGSSPDPAVYTSVESVGAVPLALWEPSEVVDATSEPTVQFGYAASYWVMSEIADEIGVDAMAEIMSVASAEADATGAPVDSVRLLELFEEVGESTLARGLFAEYGAIDSLDAESEDPNIAAVPPIVPPSDETPNVEAPIVSVVGAPAQRVSPLALALILLPMIVVFLLVYRSRRQPAVAVRPSYDPFQIVVREQHRSEPVVPHGRPMTTSWIDEASTDHIPTDSEPWVY